MSEIFILYRDVKVTSAYVSEAINPAWEDDTIRSKFLLKIEGPLGKSVFPYWCSIETKSFNQSELTEALQCLVSEAESGSNYDFPEFCSEFGYDVDSIKSRNIFEACAETAEQLNNIGEFDFGCDREFLDYGYRIYNDRIYSAESGLYCRPSEAIVLFDDEEYEATWENDRAHPGGPSTARMGDGWVDRENRMPIDDAWWTWPYSTEPVQEKYNMATPIVQLINTSTSEDDDYYATL